MQYVQILSGTSTTPSFAPIRIRRPGNVQALLPLKPFTRKEALDTWLTDLKEKGIRLLFNGVEYLVWFQTSKKNFEIHRRNFVQEKRYLKVAPQKLS